MVRRAGGVDLLAEAGIPSTVVSWERVVGCRPDVLVLMPCGFSLDRTATELDLLTARPGWKDLPAVQAGAVYPVEGPAYFHRSCPRLADGGVLLAALVHPPRFRH